MLNRGHKTLHGSEAKPPPPPLSLPSAADLLSLYLPLPLLFVTLWLQNSMQHFLHPKITKRPPHGSQSGAEATIWSSTGEPRPPKTSKNTSKNRCFNNVHKTDLGHHIPLGPPRGGPSDLKGAQSAETVSIWDTILSIFSIFFCLGCKIGQVGGPRTPKGASWTHFWGLFEGLLDAFCCT